MAAVCDAGGSRSMATPVASPPNRAAPVPPPAALGARASRARQCYPSQSLGNACAAVNNQLRHAAIFAPNALREALRHFPKAGCTAEADAGLSVRQFQTCGPAADGAFDGAERPAPSGDFRASCGSGNAGTVARRQRPRAPTTSRP